MLIYVELVKIETLMSYCNGESEPRRRSQDHFPSVEFERRLQKEAIKEFIFSEDKYNRHFYSDIKKNIKCVK